MMLDLTEKNWPKAFVLQQVTAMLDPYEPILRDGALAIDKGKFVWIGAAAQLPAAYQAWPQYSAKNYVLIPGLINAHTHAPMGFFRGFAHELARHSSETTMIEDFFFPMEKSLTADLIEPLSYSYVIDGLKSGVTCFVDAYFDEMGVGRAMMALGVRGYIGEHIADLGGPKPAGVELWERTKKTIHKWPFADKVKPLVYAHAADTVSAGLLGDIAAFARSEKLPFHMHLAQSHGERARVMKREGKSPVQYAADCGAVAERHMLVHLIAVDDQDVKLIKDAGACAVFTPISEITYEELPPVEKFWQQNIPVLLGTDCAASNDGADMLREVQTMQLCLAQKKCAYDPERLLASMTTMPAHALGDPTIGSLAVGKAADVVFLKRDITVEPLDQVKTSLLFSFQSRHVQHVLIAGEWVLWSQQPTRLKESEALTRYTQAADEILRRAKMKRY